MSSGAYRIEKVQTGAEETRSAKEVSPDLAARLPVIMREIGAGKTVKQIAKRHRIPMELAEQITRMYLTHPGVDAEGIWKRLSL